MSTHPVAVVTGSSRGIGKAIAIKLAVDGFHVVVNCVSRSDAATETVSEIRSAGGKAVVVQADVSVSEQRQRLVDRAVEEWGRIDVLVNNAGITSPGRRDLLDATEENWDQVFVTNLKGPFFLAQYSAARMLDLLKTNEIARGTIINVSSISGYAVSPDRADYCMAKAAIGMMTKLLATRFADDGIQVFEVCPGIISSDMTSPVREKYDRLLSEGLSPIRRWGTPEDVACAVSVLVSGAFPYSTGDSFNVDGGFHIRRL